MKKYHSPVDRLNAAQSLLTPKEELVDLSNSEHGFIRVAVAKNLNTPREVLEKLSPELIKNNDDQEMAIALLQNENLPIGIRERLSGLTKKTPHPDFVGIKFDIEGVIVCGDNMGRKILVSHDVLCTGGYYIYTSNDDDPEFPWFDDWVSSLIELGAYFESRKIVVQWSE